MPTRLFYKVGDPLGGGRGGGWVADLTVGALTTTVHFPNFENVYNDFFDPYL